MPVDPSSRFFLATRTLFCFLLHGWQEPHAQSLNETCCSWKFSSWCCSCCLISNCVTSSRCACCSSWRRRRRRSRSASSRWRSRSACCSVDSSRRICSASSFADCSACSFAAIYTYTHAHTAIIITELKDRTTINFFVSYGALQICKNIQTDLWALVVKMVMQVVSATGKWHDTVPCRLTSLTIGTNRQWHTVLVTFISNTYRRERPHQRPTVADDKFLLSDCNFTRAKLEAPSVHE